MADVFSLGFRPSQIHAAQQPFVAEFARDAHLAAPCPPIEGLSPMTAFLGR